MSKAQATHSAMDILPYSDREILTEANEITLDFSTFNKDTLVRVEPHCVVIGVGDLCDEFLEFCVKDSHVPKFEILHLLPQDFVRVSGHLGAFELYFNNSDKNIETITTAQIVTFAPLNQLKAYKGIHRADEYESAQDMLDALLELCGEHFYTRNIIFNPSQCQYQSRRPLKCGSGFCHKCVDVCPSLGISKDDSTMLLSLSPVDCIACGKCVSVCPTGSVQREGDTLESITLKSRLYKGRVMLVLSNANFESVEFATILPHILDTNALIAPFVMSVPDMLNETYLLTMLQESGSPLILYTSLGEHTLDSIKALNEASSRIFGLNAVYMLESNKLDELATLKPIPNFGYIYTPIERESSKDIFAERMRFWVKQGDYGDVALRGFGNLHIDGSKCTLCLSCVESCNTNALINNQSRFELLFKSSLCTGCGYCVASCAENVLGLQGDVLSLATKSFEYRVMATDEPFRCVECDKIFATRKSIQKVKSILAPAFKNDSFKFKTLECCADCKVEVMFREVEQ